MTVDAFPLQARQAGVRAERQMAFYLRRAFASSDDYAVLNNIRITAGGDTAQIDHLVISRWGLVIIESKSVSTRVRVNQRGEWMRLMGGSWQGMPSPILQATRQRDFLRTVLSANKTKLLGRVLLGGQKDFENFSMDVMVAVSDHGIIDRVNGADPKEVFKADQIPMRVKELLEARRREIGGLFSLRSPCMGIEPAEQVRLVGFLRDFELPVEDPQAEAPSTSSEVRELRQPERRETISPRPAAPLPASPPAAPLVVAPPPAVAPVVAPPIVAPQSTASVGTTSVGTASVGAPPASAPPAGAGSTNAEPPGAGHRCRHCNCGDLAIRWGKYGYYFKCLGCAGNTPLPVLADGSRPTLRKENAHFYRMSPDGSEDLYFINPKE
ncbi:nuclease-related domain-containing protein [Azospirillum sp. Sh1]|uniref:nuclease-related domain-containing protein n=1 Tax=Azospirillum sp. Sh1 TaxID=2607285 RepID=UPI0011EC44D1|nr:nuclease-related domain-containing protein [Azospirillum sp. Sh1]KAA0571155.1 NERD domain-containing protein [Azospirillum sp. Sh1]